MRKIINISFDHWLEHEGTTLNSVTDALCDDDTIWRLIDTNPLESRRIWKWEQVDWPEIPQKEDISINEARGKVEEIMEKHFIKKDLKAVCAHRSRLM